MKDLSENAQLAIDTLEQIETKGIPISAVHIMGHNAIERLARAKPGDYRKDPHEVYMRMQRNIGTCMLDQYIADNPLILCDHGFDSNTDKSATTGGITVLDSLVIDSPESVVGHIERFACAQLERNIARFNEAADLQSIVNNESQIQRLIGPNILKTSYSAPSRSCST